MLTDEQKKAYLDCGGYRCPYCGSGDIEAGTFEGEGMFQPVQCRNCEREWRDAYRLVDIEEIESGG